MGTPAVQSLAETLWRNMASSRLLLLFQLFLLAISSARGQDNELERVKEIGRLVGDDDADGTPIPGDILKFYTALTRLMVESALADGRMENILLRRRHFNHYSRTSKRGW